MRAAVFYTAERQKYKIQAISMVGCIGGGAKCAEVSLAP
jgi:hypothetical protein